MQSRDGVAHSAESTEAKSEQQHIRRTLRAAIINGVTCTAESTSCRHAAGMTKRNRKEK